MTRRDLSRPLPAGERIRDLQHAAEMLADAHELIGGVGIGLHELDTVKRLVASAHARVATVAAQLESDVERGFVTP